MMHLLGVTPQSLRRVFFSSVKGLILLPLQGTDTGPCSVSSPLSSPVEHRLGFPSRAVWLRWTASAVPGKRLCCFPSSSSSISLTENIFKNVVSSTPMVPPGHRDQRPAPLTMTNYGVFFIAQKRTLPASEQERPEFRSSSIKHKRETWMEAGVSQAFGLQKTENFKIFFKRISRTSTELQTFITKGGH